LWHAVAAKEEDFMPGDFEPSTECPKCGRTKARLAALCQDCAAAECELEGLEAVEADLQGKLQEIEDALLARRYPELVEQIRSCSKRLEVVEGQAADAAETAAGLVTHLQEALASAEKKLSRRLLGHEHPDLGQRIERLEHGVDVRVDLSPPPMGPIELAVGPGLSLTEDEPCRCREVKASTVHYCPAAAWTKASEALPPERLHVIAISGDQQRIAWIDGVGRWHSAETGGYCSAATYWRPMFKPPEESQDEFCCAPSPDGTWHCQLPTGHDGDHQAAGQSDGIRWSPEPTTETGD